MKLRLHVDSDGGSERSRYQTPSNARGKICLGVQTTFTSHRSGWAYALDALLPEHNDQGILFDGYLDRSFNSKRDRHGAEPIPYERPWVGFFHDPPAIPDGLANHQRLQTVLASQTFRASLPHCRGLFALSEHLAEYLRRELSVPVSSLLHPTEIPERIFDCSAFLANPAKKIVAIGWWLRKLTSIHHLPLERGSPYRKCRLLKRGEKADSIARALSVFELVGGVHAGARQLKAYWENTEIVSFLPDDAYDTLLSQNIVFLDLYDASANNAVVECIARGTPLLVNPLPAVVEYLGTDYPFYFATLEEAAAKALDFALVKRTHEYLLECPTRARLSQGYFLHSFRCSEVYRRLELAGGEQR